MSSAVICAWAPSQVVILGLPELIHRSSTFTDGAGLCSASVARDAARSLGYYSGPDSEPSTIQVRIGGAKGVLTVWPWMVGYQYSLRQSMEKFTSKDKGVNVIRVSDSRSCSSLGIRSEQYRLG